MILARASFFPLLWGEGGGEGERGSRHFHGLRMSETATPRRPRYSPRLRRSSSLSFRGQRTVRVLPFTATSFCCRNTARVREKVSLTVPNSAASTRLVVLSSITTGRTDSGSGQRLISQFAS